MPKSLDTYYAREFQKSRRAKKWERSSETPESAVPRLKDRYGRIVGARQNSVYRERFDPRDGLLETLQAPLIGGDFMEDDVYDSLRLSYLTPKDVKRLETRSRSYKGLADAEGFASEAPLTIDGFLGEAALYGDVTKNNPEKIFVSMRFSYETMLTIMAERKKLTNIIRAGSILARYEPHVTIFETDNYEVAVDARNKLNSTFDGEPLPILLGPLQIIS